MNDDEMYEVIPTSPIRKLENRMDNLESSSATSEVQRLIEQIIELIKSNQRIIDDIVKSDSELRNELSRLPGRIDNMVSKMDEFLDIMKSAAQEETGSGGSDILAKKITELVEHNKKAAESSQAVLSSLSSIDNRLKRLYIGSERSGGHSAAQAPAQRI